MILPEQFGSWRRTMALPSPSAQEQRPDLSIPQYFAQLKDPRRAHRRLHLLQDLIVIALCAAIAGAQDWQQIETFGRKRRGWLRRFLVLPNGIPSHDTFERVFNRLKPQAFQACFREWVQAITAALRIKHVAIDGKTLRGSGSAKLGPLHLVSAWATAQHLSLGQVAVDAQSNEITVIPVLLDLNGALVTIDAMGCQKVIAQKIVDQGGHAQGVKHKGNHNRGLGTLMGRPSEVVKKPGCRRADRAPGRCRAPRRLAWR